MKYKIGYMLKESNYDGLIVLATKEMPLNENTLLDLNKHGSLKINGIARIAISNVVVLHKDYMLCKILSFDKDGIANLDMNFGFKEYFEDDIYF